MLAWENRWHFGTPPTSLSRSGECAPSVWNFCARFSDVISRGNRWWGRKMSSVFSGSNFSMQCVMYWLIMNNRITLKKLTKKKQNWDVTKKRNRKRAWETGNWKKGKKSKNWWWRYWSGQPGFKLGFCHELAFFFPLPVLIPRSTFLRFSDNPRIVEG